MNEIFSPVVFLLFSGDLVASFEKDPQNTKQSFFCSTFVCLVFDFLVVTVISGQSLSRSQCLYTWRLRGIVEIRHCKWRYNQGNMFKAGMDLFKDARSSVYMIDSEMTMRRTCIRTSQAYRFDAILMPTTFQPKWVLLLFYYGCCSDGNWTSRSKRVLKSWFWQAQMS